MKGGDEMAGRRKWIVVLSVILVLLLIVAGLCYVKGWSFTGNKDGAGEREHWQEVLSKEVLEQYDSGVSYKELVEEPEKYQQKTTVVLSGTAEAVSDAQGGSRQVDFQTEDGRLIAYAEDKTGNLEIEQGKEYVICGHFQGLDVSGEVPMVQALVIEPL